MAPWERQGIKEKGRVSGPAHRWGLDKRCSISVLLTQTSQRLLLRRTLIPAGERRPCLSRRVRLQAAIMDAFPIGGACPATEDGLIDDF